MIRSRAVPSDGVFVTLAVALSLSFLAVVCFRPTGTIDLWWTLAAGDYIRTQGDVPRTALWTIEAVRDLPYVCHSWLAALGFSAVAAAFGLDAVPAVPTVIGFAVFGAMIATSRRLGASWLLSVVVADLVLYVLVLRMIARAEVFSYLYLALALNRIAAYARSGRARDLAWLVPIAVLWVNSHASFPLLPALLLLASAGVALDAWRSADFRRDAFAGSILFSHRAARLGATAVLVAFAAFANPYGGDLVLRIIEPSRPDSITRILEEWQPLYSAGALPPQFTVPAGLMAAAIAVGFRRMSFVSILLAIALVALALSAYRHITFFAIGVAYVLGDFAAKLELGRRGRATLGAILLAALLVANAHAMTTLGFGNRRLSVHPSDWITRRALQYVLDHVQGNVLNSYDLGGVLIYFGYPRIRVAIDSRADPFPASYYRDHQNALYGGPRATLAFVDRHQIDDIVVERQEFDGPLRRHLHELRGFRVVYADELTVVLSRERRAQGRTLERERNRAD